MRDHTQLSENFFRYEFACKCGCGLQTADVEIITVWQRIRTHYDRLVTINSGARCAAHNQAVGGYPNSRHLRGEAADGTVDHVPAQEVQSLLRSWYPNKLGIGRGRNFTHIDVRPSAANWSY